MADKYNFSDFFISYSRADGEFVKTVVDVLFDRGYEIWIDWDDIPQTVNWWQEIKAGIEASNTFVFVVTANSANSKVCYDEVQYAVENNKRIIPLIPDKFDDKESEEKLHPAIRNHNWFVFGKPDKSFGENIDRLLETLTMDVDYLRHHTRYLVRAREWLERSKNKSFLLRGLDASEAHDWVEASADKSPAPSQLQMDYVNACMAQLGEDKRLDRQQETIFFIDRSVIPAVVFSILTIWYYGWQTFPESIESPRTLIELTFGSSITAGILFAFMILYGDELVRLRYPNHWILRLGSSFVFAFIIGSALSGFLQVIFFGSRLDWLPVFGNGFMLSLAPILSATFKLRGWQSFILAFICIYIGIQLNHAVNYDLASSAMFPVYHFKSKAQVMSLGLPMAAILAFGMYARPLIQDLLRWRKKINIDV